MNKLIEYSIYLAKYLVVIQKESTYIFKTQINISKNFFYGIYHYLSICSEIKVNSIYLFIINLFIVYIDKFDKFSNYYFSFNSVPSEFILELKIINLFIHSILRRYYSSFINIRENEDIIRSILKE